MNSFVYFDSDVPLMATLFENIMMVMIGFVPFYFTAYYLVPKYLYQKKFIIFFSIVTVMAITMTMTYLLYYYINIYIFHLDEFRETFKSNVFFNLLQHFFIIFWTYMVPLISSGTIKVMSDRFRSETKLNEIKEEKLSTELNFLRSQINPHFLFNVMNTIYFQISKENKKARQLVEIISDMLRYQLYECTAPKVDIEKELEYLNNYIYIKKFKKGFRGNIELTIDPDVRCRSIAPLLIQPIVENAFNYLEITRNNKVMYFNITNYENNGILIQISNEGAAIPNGSYITDDTQLINFKRRLEILYPDQHSFAHHKDKAHYFSKLILNHG